MRTLFLLILITGAAGVAESATLKPNVIVILVDDMGWQDTGFAGSRYIETPQLDRYAATRTLFTQPYASAPNCAPTRACLMSGQYTPRHGVYTVVDDRHAPGSAHHKIMAAESCVGFDLTAPRLVRQRESRSPFCGMNQWLALAGWCHFPES